MKKAFFSRFNDFFGELMKSKMFFNSAVISTVSIGAGFVNFLFTLIIGRILGKQQYGVIAPLLSFFLIVSLPASALQMVFSKDISSLLSRGTFSTLKEYIVRIFKLVLFFIIIIESLLFLSLPFLKSYFHLNENLTFVFIFILSGLTLFIIPFNSLIQSREDLRAYIISNVIANLTKFFVGVTLVYILSTYFGVLIALFISQGALISFLLFDFFKFRNKNLASTSGELEKDFLRIDRIMKSFLNSFVSVFAFQLFSYMDTILARHYLPEESGVYAMVAMLGKASFYIASSVSFVMLPLMSKDKKNMEKSNLKALLFLTLILLSYIFVLVFGGNFISSVLFANKFIGMEKILSLYGFMFLPYALISYFVNYYVIKEKLFYSITIFSGILIQYFGMYFFHTDLIQISLVVGFSGGIVLVVLLADLLLFFRKKLQ